MDTYTYDINDRIDVILKGKKLLDKESEFQRIEIFDTEDYGRYLMLDTHFQLCEKEEYKYHEGLVHPGLLSHPDPKKVIVIGGGDGGITRELLKHPVDAVVLAELDPEVIAVSKEYLPTVSDGSLDNSKVKIVCGDGKKTLEESEGNFDVIVIDLTEPQGPSKYLFTKEFYTLVKSKLAPKGVMLFDADGPDFNGIFPNLIKTVETVFNYVYPYIVPIPSYYMRQGFAICSEHSLDAMQQEEKVQEVMEHRGLRCKLFNAKEISNVFTRSHEVEELLKGAYKISTDADPIEVE